MLRMRPANNPPRNTRAGFIFPIRNLRERSLLNVANSKGAEGTVGRAYEQAAARVKGKRGKAEGQKRGSSGARRKMPGFPVKTTGKQKVASPGATMKPQTRGHDISGPYERQRSRPKRSALRELRQHGFAVAHGSAGFGLVVIPEPERLELLLLRPDFVERVALEEFAILHHPVNG